MTNLGNRIHWVCSFCGEEALKLPINKGKKRRSISTYHLGHCDVCQKKKVMVTEARDFGYPIFKEE